MQEQFASISECDACINNDDSALQLAESLERNEHLKKLIVSFEEDARLNEETAAILARAIGQAPIVALTLIWQEFQSELHTVLARRLMEAVKQSTSIIILDLHSMVGEIEILVDSFSNLQSLGCYDDWNPQDMQQLAESLYKASSLTSFTLHGVDLFSADALGVISQGISNNLSITNVAFRGCGISDEGVKAFHKYWHDDSPIQTLEWSANVIQAEGALLLLEAASSHEALENLYIVGSEDVGYDGLVNLILKIPTVQLKRLTLATCVPDQVALDPALKNVRQFIGRLLAQATKANTRLLKVDINGNGIYIDCQGLAEELDFYTACNEYKPLMQSIPPTLWCRIMSEFGDDISLTYYFLKEQPTLWPEQPSADEQQQQQQQPPPEKKQRRGSKLVT